MRPHTAGPRRKPARRDRRGRSRIRAQRCDCPQTIEELLIQAIRANGYGFRYVEYCEDHRTPGILGAGAGVTDREHCEVKISRVVTNRDGNLEEVLWHELRHVENPSWDCGTGYVY